MIGFDLDQTFLHASRYRSEGIRNHSDRRPRRRAQRVFDFFRSHDSFVGRGAFLRHSNQSRRKTDEECDQNLKKRFHLDLTGTMVKEDYIARNDRIQPHADHVLLREQLSSRRRSIHFRCRHKLGCDGTRAGRERQVKGGCMKRLWFATIIAVLFAASAFAEKKEVTIPADDGFPLKATLYSSGKAGPGLLLLHQCNADRQIYDNLGTMLSAAGYNALALDFRGFGGSKNAQYKDLASSREKMPGDVDAALKFLTSQQIVNKPQHGVVASSCGVNQAIQSARRHPEIRTLVLLSGGTDADGEAFIQSSAKMPIFGAASEEDTSAAASIKKIV